MDHTIFIFLVFLGAPASCAHTGQWRIMGGQSSTTGQHPWQVGILFSPDFISIKTICSGAFLDDHTVITAAHCFDDSEDPKQYFVTSGGLSLKGNFVRERTTGVVDIRLHEDRMFDEDGYDIAILKLKKSLTMDNAAQPIALPESKLDRAKVNDTCQVAGWGATTKYQDQLSTKALLYTDLKIRNNAYCDRVYPRANIQEEHVCAGGFIEGKNACKGDSGAPLVCYRHNQWQIEGVLSFGQRFCGKYGIPTVYASTAYWLDWIQENRA